MADADTVLLTNPKTGQVEEHLAEGAKDRIAEGYRGPTVPEYHEFQLRKEYEGTLKGTAIAAGTSAASAATFGSTDIPLGQSEAVRASRELNPVASGLGTAASFFIPGAPEAEAISGAGKLAEKATARFLEPLVSAGGSKAANLAVKGATVAAREAAASVPYSIGESVSEKSLGDPRDVGEILWGNLKDNALTFAGQGVAGDAILGLTKPAYGALKGAVGKLGDTFEKWYPKVSEGVGTGTEAEVAGKIAQAKSGTPAAPPINEQTISPTPGPRPDKDAAIREMGDALGDTFSTAKEVRKDLTGYQRPMDREELLKDIPPEVAQAHAHEVAAEASDAIEKMKQAPEQFDPAYVKRLEQKVEGFARRAGPGADAHEVYLATDEFRDQLGDILGLQNQREAAPSEAAARSEIDALRYKTARRLENEDVWGTQGSEQAKINRALSEQSTAERNLQAKTTEDLFGPTGRKVKTVSPQKIATWAQSGTGASGDLKRELLETYINKTKALHEVASEVAGRNDILSGSENRDALVDLLGQTKQAEERVSALKESDAAWQSRDQANLSDVQAKQAALEKEAAEVQAQQNAIRGAKGGHSLELAALLTGHLHAAGGIYIAKKAAALLHGALTDVNGTVARYARIHSLMQKTNKLIESHIDSVLSGAKTATKLGGRAAVAGEMTREDARDLYEKRVKEITQLAGDPQTLTNHLQNIQGSLNTYAPNSAMEFSATGSRVINALAEQSSLPPIPGMFAPKAKPSDQDVANFNYLHDLAANPVGKTIKGIKNGNLPPAHIKFMQTAFPAKSKMITTHLLNKVTDMGPAKVQALPYKTRLGIATWLQTPLDGTMTPQFIRSSMQIHAVNQAPTPQPRPAAAGRGASKMANSFETTLQKSQDKER